MAEEYTVVSFYRFIKFSDNSLESFVSHFKEKALEHKINGLVISALEGLNGTIAGSAEGIKEITKFLSDYSNGGDWKFKYSFSCMMPFKRFTVRFRNEIVTSGNLNLDMPNIEDDTHVSPDEWHKILESNQDCVLIDVRNDYEVEIGKFKGAIDPKTKDFKEFPKFVEQSGIPKDKEILMYCTGGIRCEKASLEMKELGYYNIKQLDGGILRYIEKYPNGYFEGECFVFDDRVALDPDLKPTKKYGLCPHCGDAALEYIDCKNCHNKKKVCSKCQKVEVRNTCSKNCRYHYSLKLDGGMKNSKELAKLIIIFFLSFTTCLTSLSDVAFAENISPEDTVRTVIDEIKAKGDPSPVVDHVNWDDGFEKLPQKNKEVMGVNNANELREFYRRILLSPSSEIEKMFESKFKDKLDSLGPEKVKTLLAGIKERAKQKEEEIKLRLKESKYKVGNATIEGDTASVPLTTIVNGVSNTDSVKLVKKEGRWLFASLGSGFNMGSLSGQKAETPKEEVK